jgi:hypothetical protein
MPNTIQNKGLTGQAAKSGERTVEVPRNRRATG